MTSFTNAIQMPSSITRVEVIDEAGRASNHPVTYVLLHIQDEGRTLQVFLQNDATS